jgi:hypothetical protein
VAVALPSRRRGHEQPPQTCDEVSGEIASPSSRGSSGSTGLPTGPCPLCTETKTNGNRNLLSRYSRKQVKTWRDFIQDTNLKKKMKEMTMLKRYFLASAGSFVRKQIHAHSTHTHTWIDLGAWIISRAPSPAFYFTSSVQTRAIAH